MDEHEATSADPTAKIAALEEELHRLRSVVVQQGETLARLAAAAPPAVVPGPRAGSDGDGDEPDGLGASTPSRLSRRGLLLGAAGAAAAGAAVVAGAEPAAANGQGGSWTLGDGTNSASSLTGLTANLSGSAVAKIANSSTTGSGLIVQAGNPSGLSATGGVLADSHDRDGVVGLTATKAGVRGRAGVYSGTLPSTTLTGVFGEAADGIGVVGVSNSSQGVYGRSTTGNGVLGYSSNSAAVWGISTSGTGTAGESTSYYGIFGSSSTGTGVYGASESSYGGFFTSEYAQLRLQALLARDAPTGDAVQHYLGELVVDGNGTLWYCVASGVPGTWRQVSGSDVAGAFHLFPAPQRLYDSRPGTTPSTGPKTPLAANEVRPLTLIGADAATAVLVTILLVNASSGNGNFTIWAQALSKPASNTMVWGGSAGRFCTTAVSAVSAGKVNVSASLKTDLVVDVVGWWR